MRINEVLDRFYPGQYWGIEGNDYNTLFWDVRNSTPKPLLEELQSKFAELESIKSSQQNYEEALAAGFEVVPEGFSLALKKEDRDAFTSMLMLVNTAMNIGFINNLTPQTIADINGNIKTISTERFIQIMVSYGFYYKTLWDNLLR